MNEPRIEDFPFPPAPAAAPALAAADVMQIPAAAVVFGMTRKAIEGKIYRGDWLEGRQYHRDPSGSIWIDKKGVHSWVVGKA